MGKKCQLTEGETKEIVTLCSQGTTSLEIAKKLGRDHRTIKNFLSQGKVTRSKPIRGKPKALSPRNIRKVTNTLRKMPHASSRAIFHAAGLPEIPKTTRNDYLRKIGMVRKMKSTPLLTKTHKEKRVKWAKKYLKHDFNKVIWTDECRATLDGPDGWAKGWILFGQSPQHRLRRQQGGGGVMFWAAIVENELIGPFRVRQGVKINSQTYCEFLECNFLPWLQAQPNERKNALTFMQDNAPAHASKYSKHFLASQELNIMDWPPNSPDLNPIENLWAIIKRKVYLDGKQYTSLDVLWAAIQDACNEISAAEIKNLVSSVDNRLVEVLETGGAKINA